MSDAANEREMQERLHVLEEENRALRAQVEALSVASSNGDGGDVLDNRLRHAICARIVQEAPVGIAILSGPDCRISLYNPEFARCAGNPGDLHQRQLSEIFADDMSKQTFAEVLRSGTSGRVVDRPFTHISGHEAKTVYLTMMFSLLPGDQPEKAEPAAVGAGHNRACFRSG